MKTSYWTHTTEAEFKQGSFDRVVATNLGDLKLSREVKTLLGQDARVSAVYALAQAPDGTVYAGTGPEGILLAIRDDKVTTVADLGQSVHIFSLLVEPDGALLIGTGGEKGQVLRLARPATQNKPVCIFSSDQVQYVWAMARAADGSIYLATGPNGLLLQINPDGSHKVLFDSDQNNLMCLLWDGAESLYVGTDPDGLVYRVNRATGQPFVLYDAPESEISALARDAAGTLYVATAQSIADEQVETEAVAEQRGRPERENRGAPIPSERPPAPKPPEVPGPAPGEPLPIPKDAGSRPMSLLILTPQDAPAGESLQAGPSTGEAPFGMGEESPGAKIVTPPPQQQMPANGNAIYRIDPDGFVTEIFRQPVVVFSMIEQNGTLLVGTGNDGNVYQVNPVAEETLVLARVDPRQVMCLLPVKDGRVIMGMANTGEVAALGSGYATVGTYTSPVLDATQISRFGKMHLRGTLPQGARLTIATRCGNVEQSSDPGWSPWSEQITAAEFVQIPSPPARFLQYRLTFGSTDGGRDTPVVEEVSVAYQVPNLPPQIKSVSVEPSAGADAGAHHSDDGEAAAASSRLTITWQATDPNEDVLEYRVYFRQGSRGPWIVLKDKLKDPTCEWETRTVGDGRYEIKVEASDGSSNPAGHGRSSSRISDPVIVDNTPPLIGDANVLPDGAHVKLSLKVVDRTTTVARLEYAVDGSSDWQTVLPSDNIADAPQERYEFTLKGLSAGPHQIAVRATDARGNRAYETLNVTIDRQQ
ncbi:MAG TPA: hypothetical protein VNL70_05455 [Tepidisphaeraceae bacterium]|nr:hypothetical protein [Tepidisphaeraceae bacterium]